MRNGFHPFIPMLEHHVINKFSGWFIQIRIYVLYAFSILNLSDKQQLTFVRRKQESFYVRSVFGQLFAFTAIGTHFPELSVIQKINVLAILGPNRFALALFRLGNPFGFASGYWHHIQILIPFVLSNIKILNTVQYLLVVWWDADSGNSAHAPKNLRSHQPFFNFNRLLFDNSSFIGVFTVAGSQRKCHCCHKIYDFLHLNGFLNCKYKKKRPYHSVIQPLYSFCRRTYPR